jgi:ankyrin repeat protein
MTPLLSSLWSIHNVPNRDIVRLLVEYGADVNARGTGVESPTALHFAATRGYSAVIIATLIKAGANVTAVDGYQMTPRQRAIESNRQITAAILQRYEERNHNIV